MKLDFKVERKKTKQRLLHFLLRHNLIYTDGNHWTGKHEQWLRALEFDNPVLKETFDEYFFHLKELEEKIGRMARRKGQPVCVVSYANKAGKRLSRKFNRLIFRNKKSQVAVTAVARELAGFVWGLMVGQTA